MNYNQAPRTTAESSQKVQEMHDDYSSYYVTGATADDEWSFENNVVNAVSAEQQAAEIEAYQHKIGLATKTLGGNALYLAGVTTHSDEHVAVHEGVSPFDDISAPFEASALSYAPNVSQEDIWSTYEANVLVEPAGAVETVEAKEVATRFELDHAVKRAPRFSEQILDSERESTSITYIAGERYGLKTKTSRPENRSHRETVSELQALIELYDFLYTAAEADIVGADNNKKAQAMLENLTFMGEKEYTEAAQGIADSWRGELEGNPDLQIYAVAGEIAKSGPGYYEDGRPQIKSDEYMLERILSNFTDEELVRYAGRVVVDREDVVAENPDNLKVVLLDDWTISGSQLLDAKESFLRDHPDFKTSVEVQLLVATEDRIKNGLARRSDWGVRGEATPVRAYYMAHSSKEGKQSGAHITGFHSSVDYDFENDIEKFLHLLQIEDDSATMPPLTNIVRPYREERVQLTNKQRLKKRARDPESRAPELSGSTQSKFAKYMPWKKTSQDKK